MGLRSTHICPCPSACLLACLQAWQHEVSTEDTFASTKSTICWLRKQSMRDRVCATIKTQWLPTEYSVHQLLLCGHTYTITRASKHTSHAAMKSTHHHTLSWPGPNVSHPRRMQCLHHRLLVGVRHSEQALQVSLAGWPPLVEPMQ